MAVGRVVSVSYEFVQPKRKGDEEKAMKKLIGLLGGHSGRQQCRDTEKAEDVRKGVM